MNSSTSKMSKFQKGGGPQQITNQIAAIFKTRDARWRSFARIN